MKIHCNVLQTKSFYFFFFPVRIMVLLCIWPFPLWILSLVKPFSHKKKGFKYNPKENDNMDMIPNIFGFTGLTRLEEILWYNFKQTRQTPVHIASAVNYTNEQKTKQKKKKSFSFFFYLAVNNTNMGNTKCWKASLFSFQCRSMLTR